MKAPAGKRARSCSPFLPEGTRQRLVIEPTLHGGITHAMFSSGPSHGPRGNAGILRVLSGKET